MFVLRMPKLFLPMRTMYSLLLIFCLFRVYGLILSKMRRHIDAQVINRVNTEMDLFKSQINSAFRVPQDVQDSNDPLAILEWTMTKVMNIIKTNEEEANQIVLEREALEDGM